jgi:HPt (histidine-containing phosphotransfer) domain-containing protein
MHSSVLDPEIILDRVGGDVELMCEITDLFLSEYPELIAEIRAAIAAGDARRLEHSAHTLKGSVANFGATAAVEAALKLEMIGRRGDLASAPDGLRMLELHFAALAPALESLKHRAS